jgi:hypothetical protein
MSDTTRNRLRSALRRRVLVSVKRRQASWTASGYVLAVGSGLFAMSVLGEDLRFNGVQVFRTRDVTRLDVPHRRSAFLESALQLRHLSRPPKPRLRMGSIASLLASASRAFPLVTIHRERTDRGACHIGRVAGLDKRRLLLLEIDPGAKWDKHPTSYRLSEITRVDFGGGYEDALALVGGAKGQLNNAVPTRSATARRRSLRS